MAIEHAHASEYIKQSRSAGLSDDAIRQNLMNEGWQPADIDQAFSSMQPNHVEAEGLSSTGKTKKFFRKPVYAAAAIVLVLLLIFIGWKLFSGHPLPAQFVLKATMQDAAGVNPHTAFTLQSSQALSGSQVQKILKFNPPVNFSVKQVGLGNPIIKSALAADSAGSYSYQLQPTEDLKAGIVYQSLINDKIYADRQYGWAFQVKAGFQVLKTLPGNKTTYVPTNTGIEMTFNRTNIQNMDQYFTIAPKVDGRFEVYDDTAVFLPKNPLAENTVYTVTIKKGLKTQGSTDSLSDDYQFAFETLSNYTQPSSYFSFSNDFVEAPAGIKTDLSAYSNNVNSNDLSVSVYSISSPDEFLTSYQNSRTWSWGWTNYYRQNNPVSYDTKGKQPVLTFKPDVVVQDYQSYIEIPQVLNKGLYVVDVTLAGQHKQVWLQVTGAAHYFSVTHDTGLLWLDDFSSKTALKNASVDFVQSGSSSQNLGVSNADGLLQFNTPDPLKAENTSLNPNPSFFKVTDADKNVTFVKIQDRWGYTGSGVNSGDNYWKFMSTDRYTYQMTDTVRFWGVVKSRKEDVRQKKVTVALYDNSRFYDYNADFSQQQPVVSTDVMVTPFNTIEGSLSFQGLDPKTYNLVVLFGNETVSQSSIEVLTYTKPSYQLTVTTDKPAIFAGDPVTFTVKGAFFDGTPLNNITLNYNAYWNGDITGQVTLDNNGQATVTQTPDYVADVDSYYPRDLSLNFTPATAEEGQISGTGDVLVFGPHMYLQADQAKQSGDNYTFKAKVNNIDINNQVPDDNGGFRTEYIAGPVANYPISAKITKTTYNQVETGNYYDPINKTVNKTYDYVRSDLDLDPVSGTTDSNGEWSFAKNLPKADNTYYTITFSVTDAQGRIATAQTYAFYANYDVWNPSGLSLNINNETYQKEFSFNDPVNLTVQGSGTTNIADQPILYYRFQNSISKAVVAKSPTFTENFGNDFAPSVQYMAVVLGPYGFEESNSVFALFKASDNNIKINISSDKVSYRPGDKVALSFHITDKDGKPLAAQTNVAIVDEAVFHVLPYTSQQQILDSLYQTIYTYPLTGSTDYLLPKYAAGGGAEKGGCFTAGTQILLASGHTIGIENIKIGDELLTFKDPSSRTLVPAIVQGISSHEVDDFLIINNNLQVTEEHKIFLNGDWDLAGNAKVGDTLVLTDGRTQIIRSIAHRNAPHTTVYNIIVGKYHTYFADGIYVHNAEKGGTSVRSNFIDTAAFQTLQTDASGNAKMDFTTADNITSWRVTARSFDTNTLKAGENTKLVPSTLPLFVNAVLSDSYLTGDNPQVKIGLYGTGYHTDQDAQVSIASDGLKFNQTVTLKNHQATITLGNLPQGEFDLVISGKQGALSDALKKHITVSNSYYTKPSVSTVKVVSGNQSLAGNPGGFTKLEFMDAGKGKFYQDLLYSSYSGGLRVDQVVGSYFAADILSNYFKAQPQDKLDLSAYVSSDAGGIRLLPYSDPDLELSAYVSDLAGGYVSQNSVGDYFTAALHDTKTDLHRQALALYGLASLGKPVLSRLQDIQTVADLTWQDKVYVALGLVKLGDLEEARNLYQKDIHPHLHVDGSQAWFAELGENDAQIKLSDTAAVLASDLNLTDDADLLWNYMQGHPPAKDLDILQRVMFIKSAIAQTSQSAAKLHYQTNARSEDVSLQNGDTYSVTLSEDELKSLNFSNISGDMQVSSFFEQSLNSATVARDANLSLTRQYVVNGKATTSFNDSDIVKVKLFPKVGAKALNGDYQIVDYLPSGLKPVTDPYTLGIDQGYNCLWYPDKVVDNKLYFTVPKNFSTFSQCEPAVQYYARAVNKGDFTASPAQIQSALNPDDVNFSDTVKINVK
ncbi:MAG: polymorphic toxin-type HINT domain-containing protein [Candidatus Doudnabacteria bacterium]